MNAEDATLIIFTIAATIVGGIILGAFDAEATIEIFDIKSGLTDYGFESGHQQRFAVAPSDRWYVSFVDEDGDFKVSWSDDNGTIWDDVTLQSDGWKGETLLAVQGVYCWINNTTCVILRTEGADNAHDVYLFYLWGENTASDPSAWNYTTIHGGATEFWRVDARFNRTGTLWIFGTYDSDQIHYRRWNVTTATFSEPRTHWVTSSSPIPKVQIDHNNNVFIFLVGVGSVAHVYSFDKAVHFQYGFPIGTILPGAFMITENNTKVVTGHRQYLTTNWKFVLYEDVVNTSWIFNTFADDSDTWETDTTPTGHSIGNEVSLILLRREAGSDEYVKYEAYYDAAEATWDSSETVLWTTPTDEDRTSTSSGGNSLWPKIGGISVNVATNGTVAWWVWRDETGVDDDFYDILYWDNDMEFPYWDYPEPAGPGPGPGGDDYDDTTTTESPIDMTQVGELWVLLAVTAVLVGLARTYKMHIYRKRW